METRIKTMHDFILSEKRKKILTGQKIKNPKKNRLE